MLSSACLLPSSVACILERHALSLACTTSGRSVPLTSWLRLPSPHLGPSRAVSTNPPTNDEEKATSPPPSSATTSSSPSQPRERLDTPAAPLRAPETSPEARALAEKLRQSSPTGRLLDLFAPQGRQVGPRSGAPGGPAAPSIAPEAAAAAAPTDADVLQVVMRAVENVKPLMTVQASKTGNRVTYVPKPLDPGKSTRYAIKWILQAAEKRQAASRGASMSECLALELLMAYQRKGAARAKRDEVHKLALDNRANLRGRWW